MNANAIRINTFSDSVLSTLEVFREDWQPLTFTLVIHLALLILMVGWQSKSEPQIHVPDYVKARLVQIQPEVSQKKPVKKTVAKKVAPKKTSVKKTQPKKVVKQVAAVKTTPAVNAQKLAEQKREEEKLLQEQLLREQAQLEKRRAEEALAQALAEEQAQQQQLADVELAQAYATLIKEQVEQNWSRPPSARRGMEVWLEIQLVPTGYVSGVKLLKSSGNSAFDLSAELAVQKVERFEGLENMPGRVFEEQFRRFTLKFNPQDKL